MKYVNFFNLLEFNHKKYFFLVIILGFISSILEFVGISMIIPIFGLLNDSLFFDKYLTFLAKITSLEKITSFLLNLDLGIKIIYLSVFLLFFYILKNIYILLFSYIQNKLLYSIQKDLSNRLYLILISLPFNQLKNFNSSIVLKNITTDMAFLQKFAYSLISLILEFFLILLFLSFLLLYNFYLTIKVFIFFFLVSSLFYIFSKKYNKKYGKMVQFTDQQRTKNILEVFAAIKEIKIFNKINFFHEKFKSYNLLFFKNIVSQSTFLQIPRAFLETIFIFLIIFIIIFGVANNQNYQDLLLTLVIFSAVTFRIIPSFNKILIATQNIKYSSTVIENLVKQFNLLDNYKYQKSNKNSNLNKESKSKFLIEFKNVSFKHNDQNKFILKNINFKAKEGEMVALLGESGSGKSTFIDLLLGLYSPDHGSIFYKKINIKNILRDYIKLIGFVPQDPYIFNDTLKFNIALGVGNEVSLKALKSSIKFSQLKSFFTKLNNNYNYTLDEKGQNISGGQKQRLGIARALYLDPKILILDEPTSALDFATERKLYRLLSKFKRKKTIIISTHKLNNLKFFDTVYLIKDSKLIKKPK